MVFGIKSYNDVDIHLNYHSKSETFNQEMDKHILLLRIPCGVKN